LNRKINSERSKILAEEVHHPPGVFLRVELAGSGVAGI
jgi:hypothetical protein